MLKINNSKRPFFDQVYGYKLSCKVLKWIVSKMYQVWLTSKLTALYEWLLTNPESKGEFSKNPERKAENNNIT